MTAGWTTARANRLVVGAAVLGALLSTAASMTPVATSSALQPRDATSSSAISKSVTATRDFTAADGTVQHVDRRGVTLTVAQTANLRGRQRVAVSWTGAHPTGGAVNDLNLSSGTTEEYPMVLLECRGVDDPSAAADQLSQRTCFTSSFLERQVDDVQGVGSPWRLDHYADAADRPAQSPQPLPSSPPCPDEGTYPVHYLPFVAQNGTRYPACSQDTMPPEAGSDATTGGFVPNETWAATKADGTGASLFDIRTVDENASLGCSTTVPCALVAVPVEGISCDLSPASAGPAGLSGTALTRAAKQCEARGKYPPGSHAATTDGDIQNSDRAVDGELWWAASNWRNRITIPLTFAPSASTCDITDTRVPFEIYGSEQFAEASAQWSPAFCGDPSRFKFRHVQLGEPQAESQLAGGSAAMALISTPPSDGYGGVPVANAPVAVDGFAIGYQIDLHDADNNATGQYTSLKLDGRLLAKLLTESYRYGATDDPGVGSNPASLFNDPEFRALNPGAPTDQNAGGTALLNISSLSDEELALTSYINADPEARAWLDGKTDPWGMVVNPAYKNINLPVNVWPLLDSYLNPHNGSSCTALTQTPYLGLLAAPVARLFAIATAVQDAWPNVQLGCKGSGSTDSPFTPARAPRPGPGQRAILGLISVSEASRYGLATAALQTTGVTPSNTKFNDGSGRTFVSGTADGLRTAVTAAQADAPSNSWPIPYSRIANDVHLSNAYPGAMVIYAASPTTGLSADDAAHAATFIRYAAGPGQVQGDQVGQLPAGYLPMTSANGLGAFLDYDEQVARAVSAQSGTVPGVVPGVVPGAAPPTHTASPTAASPSSTSTRAASPNRTTASAVASTSAGAVVAAGPTAAPTTPAAAPPAPVGPVAPRAPAPSSAPVPSVASPAEAAAAGGPARLVGRTTGTSAGFGGTVLPLLLLVAVAGGLGALLLNSPLGRRHSR